MRDGVLIARVTAPLVDGNANRALCKLIARRAGVAPSRVTIVRQKVIRVEGIDDDALRTALGEGSTTDTWTPVPGLAVTPSSMR